MTTITSVIVGILAGWFGHSLAMKVRFKEKTIQYKVNVYDSLLMHWVRMRNFVFTHHPESSGRRPAPERYREFDQMYGESQRWVGQAYLVGRDRELNHAINELNERMYRTRWGEMELDAVNVLMEEIKEDAFRLIERLRTDIESETRLQLHDLLHLFGPRSS